jgi:NADH dehydrogenase
LQFSFRYELTASWFCGEEPEVAGSLFFRGTGKMNVIVAGGSGFLGRFVVSELTARGHHVIVLSRRTPEVPDTDDVEYISCDVASGRLPLERLRNCDAIVNLTGIKRSSSTQTFEQVHVDAVKHLIEAARQLGLRRFVHISVVAARPDDRHAYHDTKWQAEELMRDSGLDFTILRPGVIYGRGDDMITHLVKMIRFCPLFPVVGKGDSFLQPVSGEEVARVVAAALERDVSIRKSYDVVGPQTMMLRDVVRTVAGGTGLNVWILPTPVLFQRVSVWGMNVLFRNPLSTPAQLQMLIDGLAGNPEAVKSELGVETQLFDAATVAGVQESIPSLFGLTLRFIRGSGYSPQTGSRETITKAGQHQK